MKSRMILVAALLSLALSAVNSQAQYRLRRESVSTTSTTTSATPVSVSSAAIEGMIELIEISVSGGSQTLTLTTDDGRTLFTKSAVTTNVMVALRVAATDNTGTAITNTLINTLGTGTVTSSSSVPVRPPVVGSVNLNSSLASTSTVTATAVIYYTPGVY